MIGLTLHQTSHLVARLRCPPVLLFESRAYGVVKDFVVACGDFRGDVHLHGLHELLACQLVVIGLGEHRVG